MVQITGYAVKDATSPLEKYSCSYRDLRDNDVLIDIKYCGICHTDLHMMKNDWKASIYPMIPGHEVVGVISQVGKNVKTHKIGDRVGVGCMIWSCRECNECKESAEQYCPKVVLTYSGKMPDGEITMGGYADKMVAPEEFVVAVPKELPLDKAAPLCCAGITCWSPMKYWKMDTPGKRIGVIGIGGLGHLAVQFGKAFGNEVVAISSSRAKEQLAKELGADAYCVSTDPDSVKKFIGTLDYIVDTVSADKPIELYLSLLRTNGVLCTVGLPEDGIALKVAPASLIWQRKSLVGSVVGSVKELAEMFEFCAKHNVLPMIETVPAKEVNMAVERLKKNEVRFRFVLDFEHSKL